MQSLNKHFLFTIFFLENKIESDHAKITTSTIVLQTNRVSKVSKKKTNRSSNNYNSPQMNSRK